MKHVFLMNVHNDVQQAIRTASLLREYFPGSSLLASFDGWPNEQMRELINFCHVIALPYEPQKCKGIVVSFNELMKAAHTKGLEMATFLHADMIPTDTKQFERFRRRFKDSGKLLTHTSMWPGHYCLSFYDLHFDVRRAVQANLFPIHYQNLLPADHNFNEMQFTTWFDLHAPRWRDLAYNLWTMVMSYTVQYEDGGVKISKISHTPDLQFQVHNFTPETSVIHTNDLDFWDNYGELVR